MIRWSGAALVALGVLHLLVLGLDAAAEAPGWIRGELWTRGHWRGFEAQEHALLASNAAFWATVGSFAVPTIVLGWLVARMARRGERIPRFVGGSMLAWALVGAATMEPSGFPLAVVVAACLVAGVAADRRRAPRPDPRSAKPGGLDTRLAPRP